MAEHQDQAVNPDLRLSSSVSVPDHVAHVFKPKASRYALIIPVLNEGERITTQLQRSSVIAGKIDMVLVDGGSSDGATAADRVESSGLRALLIRKAPGRLGTQLRIGMAWAMKEGYEGVVLIDGNNKDEPSEVVRFTQALDEGWDHVQGSRFLKGGKAVNNPASRLWGIKLVHAPMISVAARRRYTDTTNGFRAYSKRFLMDPRVQPFRDLFEGYELHYYLSIAAGKLGFKVKEVPVSREYPASGPIPSKIKGVRGNLKVLGCLWAACTGKFDPARDM